MSFDELKITAALKKELEKRSYSFIDDKNKEGGWGKLYKVYSRLDSEVRAVKIYKEPLDETNREIYHEEIRKLKRYDSPYIVKAYGTGQLEIDNNEYFFAFLEHIEGKSLDEIKPHLFYEKHTYDERIELFNHTMSAIEVFRSEYELHNDLHLGNIMLTKLYKIKIIDFGSSKYSYDTAEPDFDMYMIKNELLNFFLKEDEIKNLAKKIDMSSVSFNEFQLAINKIIFPKEKLPVTNNRIKCYNAIKNIIDFYFENFDNTTQKPKQNIEKAKRRHIMKDIQDLNNFKETAMSIGISISGNWDSNTHSLGINHEIFITINNDVLIRVVQHEFGEAMKVQLTFNNEPVLKWDDIDDYINTLRSSVSSGIEENKSMQYNTEIYTRSFDDIEEILRTSDPNDWRYNDSYGIYTYKPDVDLNIHIKDEVQNNGEAFHEGWIDNFSDKNAFKVVVRVFYRGAFVTEYFYVYVDGYRMILPVPKSQEDLTITQFQFNLGRILNCQEKRQTYYPIYVFNIAKFKISEEF